MPGSRFPRWARPRVIRAPAPPSLSALVKLDDVVSLQKRLCGVHWDTVSENGDFWEKQWPGLVRKACENLSEKSVVFLLTIYKRESRQIPPCPPHTLGWLLKGLVEQDKTLSNLDRVFQDAVLPRLAQSPVAFRAEDGVRIVGLNGLWSALYNGAGARRSEFHELEQQENVREAWRKWCASTANQQSAILALTNPNPLRFFNPAEAFASVASTLQGKRRDGFIHNACDHLEKERQPFVGAPRSLGKWWKVFQQNGWALNHPVWEQWGQSACRELERVGHAGSIVANDWKHLFLHVQTSPEVMPGWGWNQAMARGWLVGNKTTVLNLIEQVEAGKMVSDQPMNQVATFLRESMAIQGKLKSLGLWDDNHEQQWEQASEEVMGVRWEDRLQAVMTKLSGDPDSEVLQKHWAQWKADRLEVTWQKPAASARPKVRI